MAVEILKPRLDILPPSQLRFWREAMPAIPGDNVLYGGTAVALRYGHRRSVDFDFFSATPLDPARKSAILLKLNAKDRIEVLSEYPNSVTALWGKGDDGVKVSLFGGLAHGQVKPPSRSPGGPLIASPIDLLATKLKVLHQRIEPKDYLDIDCLLRQGLQLSAGLGAAGALYGDSVNPLDTAKAVAWFKDGGLEWKLPADVRERLAAAAMKIDPAKIVIPPLQGSIGSQDAQAPVSKAPPPQRNPRPRGNER